MVSDAHVHVLSLDTSTTRRREAATKVSELTIHQSTNVAALVTEAGYVT